MAVALVFGLIYAAVLNRLKLNEEIVGTFAGYSFIPIMNLFYTFVPVTNRQMLYPIGGQGLRPKVNLENYFGQILDRLWQIEIGGVVIPLGLLLFWRQGVCDSRQPAHPENFGNVGHRRYRGDDRSGGKD